MCLVDQFGWRRCRTSLIILAEIVVSWQCRTADIDEKALGDRSVGADPRLLVRTLAVAKAHAILKSLPSLPTPPDPRSLLLTADQGQYDRNRNENNAQKGSSTST